MKTSKKRRLCKVNKGDGKNLSGVASLDPILSSPDPAVKAFMVQAFHEEMTNASGRRSFLDVHNRVLSRMARRFSYLLPQAEGVAMASAVGN